MQFAEYKRLVMEKGKNERNGEQRVEKTAEVPPVEIQKAAAADASHKAYCDKELGETRAKKADKDVEIEKFIEAPSAEKLAQAQEDLAVTK